MQATQQYFSQCRNAYFGEQGESNLGVCEWKTRGKTSAFASYIYIFKVFQETQFGVVPVINIRHPRERKVVWGLIEIEQ